jgi:hypothetical protein
MSFSESQVTSCGKPLFGCVMHRTRFRRRGSGYHNLSPHENRGAKRARLLLCGTCKAALEQARSDEFAFA